MSRMEMVATCSLSYFCLQFGSFTLARVGLQSEVPIGLVMGLAGLCVFAPVFFRKSGRLTHKWRRLRSSVFWIFALITSVAFSTLWGPVGDYWSEVALLASMALGLGLVYPALKADPERAISIFAWWVFAMGVLFAFAGLAASGDRVSVFGGGPNTYARVVGAGTLAAVFLVQRRAPTLLLLAIPLQLAALIASGSRGGLLAVLCGYSVLLVATLGRSMIPWRKLLFGGVVVAIAAPLTVGSLVARLADSWQTRYVRLTFEQQYVSGRDNLWTESIEFLGSNLLFGGGFGGFADFIGIDSYPHNLFLDVGVRLGLPGIFILVAGLAAAIGRPRLRVLSPSSVFALSLAAAFFAASMVSGWFFDSRFMWVALMMYVASVSSDAVNTRPARPTKGATYGRG